MNEKKVIYIAGPIAGVEKYWEAFEQAEDDLSALGYIPLSPARLPMGLTNEQYARIDMAMLDSADAVLFIAGWENSEGAKLEKRYTEYIKKPHVAHHTEIAGKLLDTPSRRAWLEIEFMEAFQWHRK
jgi:hypothetical protein